MGSHPQWRLSIESMYGIYANIWGILMVNVTIYSIHGSYGYVNWFTEFVPTDCFCFKGQLARSPTFLEDESSNCTCNLHNLRIICTWKMGYTPRWCWKNMEIWKNMGNIWRKNWVTGWISGYPINKAHGDKPVTNPFPERAPPGKLGRYLPQGEVPKR